MLTRYWVSWWSGYWADEGCTEPDFQLWISGQRDRENKDPESNRDECSICAVIDADNEQEIEEVIAEHFPDYEMRFCNPCEPDWVPNDRFPGFQGRTALRKERLALKDVLKTPGLYGIIDFDLDPFTAVARYQEWGSNWSRGLDHAKACSEEAAYFKIDARQRPPEVILVKQSHKEYSIIGVIDVPKHMVQSAVHQSGCKNAACGITEEIRSWLKSIAGMTWVNK